MNLYWKKTGDSIIFNPHNEEFSRFYIENFNKPFKINSSKLKLETFDNLKKAIADTNLFLERFRIPRFELTDDLHRQKVLNSLHEEWVKLQIKHRNLSTIAEKISKKCKEDLDNINHFIHDIESSFIFEYRTYDLVVDQVDNIFGTEILDNGRFNIIVHYDNLGRSTLDKWYHGDENIFDIDTNDYKKVGGSVIFNLNKSYTQPLPKEYIDYCEKMKIKAIPQTLPLGNFEYDDIDNIRLLFLRNFKVEDNPIFFEI